jgi:hypothetical protein
MANIRIFSVFLFAAILSSVLPLTGKGSSVYPDIRESVEIGRKGGSLIVEDPESGISVGLMIPEGALPGDTTITIVLHGTKQPGVIGKTHINGISILPKNLLFLEKVHLDVYNPPGDVTKGMILYNIINSQFIIPVGDIEHHIDENYIGGSIYITGNFNLGTPTNTEAAAQSKKLAEFNPRRPLASYENTDKPVLFAAAKNGNYFSSFSGGPSINTSDFYLPRPATSSIDEEECMRWQKALTQIEGHMTWIEHFIYTNNPSAEQAERNKARDAIQEAIDGYLKKPSPANRCGSYIRAAAKYLEAATLLGMNLGDESPIAQKFNQLVDECSFVFTVETYEWINHPKEKHSDGATTEEKSDWYGTIKCHIPWKEFISSGTQSIKGEGTMNLHWEDHWVGDEKESHSVTDGSWKSDKIEGVVNVHDDGHGQLESTANITIYWTKRISTHIWGKTGKDDPPYDKKGTDTQSDHESKSYPLKNGYEEKIGNDRAGFSFKVLILKQPGDDRDDPNDCF